MQRPVMVTTPLTSALPPARTACTASSGSGCTSGSPILGLFQLIPAGARLGIVL
jgi:hypothetical protein